MKPICNSGVCKTTPIYKIFRNGKWEYFCSKHRPTGSEPIKPIRKEEEEK